MLTEKIKSLDTVGIISEHVSLKKQGKYHVGLCPFHDDRNPSFFVRDNRFKCFSCNISGDVVDFEQKYHDLSFKDALRHLGIKRGRVTPKVRREIQHRKRKAEAVKRFRKWCGHYGAHLGALINRTERLMKNIPPEDLDLYAPLLHRLPIWEYHSDILINGSDRQKLELYKDVSR